MNQIILECVEDARVESEIDVLLAIGEGYSKILTIASENDFKNMDTVMESFGIFMEADSDNNSSGQKNTSSIKTLFTKIINFVKETFKKISGVFKKKFINNKSNIYLVGNILRIMDALEKVEQPNKPKPVNEYNSTEFSDEDIYQELWEVLNKAAIDTISSHMNILNIFITKAFGKIIKSMIITNNLIYFIFYFFIFIL